jgi:hypothetical protein
MLSADQAAVFAFGVTRETNAIRSSPGRFEARERRAGTAWDKIRSRAIEITGSPPLGPDTPVCRRASRISRASSSLDACHVTSE